MFGIGFWELIILGTLAGGALIIVLAVLVAVLLESGGALHDAGAGIGRSRSEESLSMLGVLLTKWTVRLALICYALCVADELTFPPAIVGHEVHLWTLGCALFVVHVACAFHFYHHWSHQPHGKPLPSRPRP